jgi:hypothetical protein
MSLVQRTHRGHQPHARPFLAPVEKHILQVGNLAKNFHRCDLRVTDYRICGFGVQNNNNFCKQGKKSLKINL